MSPKTAVAAGLALVAGLAIGIGVNDHVRAAASSETFKQIDLFGDVFERVRSDYVEEVTDQQLIENAINGMLTSLDPHSSYMDEKSFKDMQVSTRGEFGGLGIEVTMENGFVKVVSPIDETPAARAGVKPGDFITHLDGKPVLGLTLNEAVERMRGLVNTDIKLTVRREGREPFDITITRAVIKIQSVRSRLEGDVGYVRITTFNEQTTTGLARAIKKLKDDSETAKKPLIGYIVDLRNNPGGLLDEAVSVSDTFLDKGEIVSTKGRHQDDAQRRNATPGDLTDGKPIVVLINGGSASASEIVAGALQDHRRALVLGTKSFGKGSVQTIIQLPGHGAMRLTTARYYTPSGRSIQLKGIEPDIAVEPARIERAAAGQRRSEADLRGALSNDTDKDAGKPAQTPPAATPPAEGAGPEGSRNNGTQKPAGGEGEEGAATGAKAETAEDYQLTRALDLLRGLHLYGNQRKASAN